VLREVLRGVSVCEVSGGGSASPGDVAADQETELTGEGGDKLALGLRLSKEGIDADAEYGGNLRQYEGPGFSRTAFPETDGGLRCPDGVGKLLLRQAGGDAECLQATAKLLLRSHRLLGKVTTVLDVRSTLVIIVAGHTTRL
jgi:hypothetical protein